MPSRFTRGIALLSVFVLTSGCDDPVSLENRVAAAYDATSYRVVSDGETRDFVEAGAVIGLFLQKDGTVTGYVFVPGGGVGGADVSENLEGSWKLENNAVRVTTASSTFLRNALLEISEGTLIYQDVGVRIEFTRKRR